MDRSIRGERRGHDPTTMLHLALTRPRVGSARSRSAADVVLCSDMTSPCGPWTLPHLQSNAPTAVILLLPESRCLPAKGNAPIVLAHLQDEARNIGVLAPPDMRVHLRGLEER